MNFSGRHFVIAQWNKSHKHRNRRNNGWCSKGTGNTCRVFHVLQRIWHLYIRCFLTVLFCLVPDRQSLQTDRINQFSARRRSSPVSANVTAFDFNARDIFWWVWTRYQIRQEEDEAFALNTEFPEFPSGFAPFSWWKGFALLKALSQPRPQQIKSKTEISSVLPDFFQTSGSPVFHQGVPAL